MRNVLAKPELRECFLQPRCLRRRRRNPSTLSWQESLVGHTSLVLEAAQSVLAVLDDANCLRHLEVDWSEFRLLVLLGAVFHDLGKATNVFQAMLQPGQAGRSLARRTHPVRHEVLSALALTELNESTREWLGAVPGSPSERFPWCVAWIAGGHHVKLHRDNPCPATASDALVRRENIPAEFIFYGADGNVDAILRMAGAVASRDPPRMQDISVPVSAGDDPATGSLETVVDAFVDASVARSASLTRQERAVLASAKAIVVAADVAGSALAATGRSPKGWIRESCAEVLSKEDLQKVISERLGNGGRLLDFQQRVAATDAGVTVVIAGCGSGKTLAAYAWGGKHACGRKLFSVTPQQEPRPLDSRITCSRKATLSAADPRTRTSILNVCSERVARTSRITSDWNR